MSNELLQKYTNEAVHGTGCFFSGTAHLCPSLVSVVVNTLEPSGLSCFDEEL